MKKINCEHLGRQNVPAYVKQAIKKISVGARVGSQIEPGRASQAVQDSRRRRRNFASAQHRSAEYFSQCRVYIIWLKATNSKVKDEITFTRT